MDKSSSGTRGEKMNTKKLLNRRVVTTLFFCVIVGMFFPPAIWSAVDTDGDGFTDAEETAGITLVDGNSDPTITVPPCAFTPGEDRNSCLDPSTQDLFVILVPDTNGSLLPADPLLFVHRPKVSGGLGLATHIISADQAPSTRYVTPNQKAVRVTENLNEDPGEVILGIANQGTPMGLDRATVYTKRIFNHVNDVYGDPAAVPSGFIDDFIRHTIAHEVGHMTNLAIEYNRRFGGYHYKTGSEVMMEQSVSYTTKKGVSFNLSTEFSVPSQEGVQLN
jgi:hypothetical protein